VDACASNVAVLDESGRTILYASKAWRLFEETFLFGIQENIAASYFEQFRRFNGSASDPGSQSSTLRDDIDLLSGGQHKELHGQYSYRGVSGTGTITVHAARLNLPPLGFRILITHQDAFSPREALRKSERRLSQLLDTTKIVAWEAEPENWRFTYVSDQAGKMLGYPVAAWYERDFFLSNIHPSDRPQAFATCRQQTQGVDNFDFTFRMIARNGSPVWIHNLVSVTRENGQPVAVHGFMIDITERKRTQEALRDLGGRLIAAQEEERSRVARELHDDLNQRMALLAIELEQLGPEIEKPRALRRRVEKLQEQVHEISTDIHRLSYRLHPSKLDHLGLAPAVQSLCKELSVADKLKIDFYQDGFPADLPKDLTLCVFRIAQEALRNCVKHSGAQLAQVRLQKTREAIRLSVSDDGCGFDVESNLMRQGLGFTSMRERLRLVNGSIEIRSQVQQGTVIDVMVPLTPEFKISARDTEFGPPLRFLVT
jgi:PAS domain S-box-containing protein